VLTYLPVAAIIAVGLLAAGRIGALRLRGISAVGHDAQRSLAEKIFEASTMFLLIFWAYLVIDYADGRGPRWLPAWLDRTILDAAWAKILSAALLVAGVVLYGAALIGMGDSWRMGIDRDAHQNPPPLKGGARGGINDVSTSHRPSGAYEPLTQPLPSGERGSAAALVTTGIFARSRNPIYLSFDLLFFGSFLIHGRVVLLIVTIALVTFLHIQILREERFLGTVYGDHFADYRRRVRRYI
jgi:hypothetical protein